MFLVAKKCSTDTAVCTSTVPWWINQFLFPHCSNTFIRLPPPSDVANPPSSNAGQALGLEKQAADEECPHGLNRSLTSSWCSTSLASLSMDMDRECFSADMNDIWLLHHNRKPRLCLAHFRCRYLSMKWKLMQMHCSFKSAIRKSQTALHLHEDKHLLGHVAEVCGRKIHWTNAE